MSPRNCVRLMRLVLLLSLIGSEANAQVVFGGAQQTVQLSGLTGGLSHPGGLAVDGSGDVFIADSDNNRIAFYDASHDHGPGYATGLNDPTGMAYSSDGHLYIANSGSNQVLVSLSFQTPTPLSISGITLNAPTGVALDGIGNIYIADSGNNRVVKASVSGTNASVLYHNVGSMPYGIAVDSNFNVYFTDTTNNDVTEIHGNGSPNTTFASGFNNPTGIAVDLSGNVYVADTGNNRVVQIPVGGGNQTLLGTGMSSPNGLAFDNPYGNLYVSDSRNNRVLEIHLNVANLGTSPVSTAAVQPVELIYNFTAPETITATTVLTTGLPNLDFSDAGGSTCSGSFSVGGQCVENVNFTPEATGSREGDVTLSTSTGPLIETPMTGTGTGPQATFAPATPTVVLNNQAPPSGMDSTGNIYLVNSQGQITRQSPAGAQSAFGSAPTSGYLSGFPSWVAVDGAGNLYGNGGPFGGNLEEIPAGGSAPTLVATSNGNISGGPATDGLGNLFFLVVPSTGSGFLVKLHLTGPGWNPNAAQQGCVNSVLTSSGASTSLPACGAGTLTVLAQNLYQPGGIALDAAGNIYVADYRGVDKFSPDGSTKSILNGGATLGYLGGLSVDSAGNVYTVWTDAGELLELPVGGTSPIVLASNLTSTGGLALDSNDNLWLQSGGPNLTSIYTKYNRKIPPSFTYASTVVGQSSASQTVTVENDGNAALTFTGLSIAQGFTQQGIGTTSCSATTVLQSGTNCLLQLAMVPFQAGTLTGGAVLTDNNLNATGTMQTVSLSGVGTAPVTQPQTITFTPPTSPITYGASPITLLATGGGSGNPVIFSVVSGPGTVTGSTLTVTGVGTIVVAANQAGNTNYTAATQVTQNIVVNQATQTITFTAPASITYTTSPILLSATAGASGNSVTFSIVSGPGTLSGAVFSATGLTVTGVGTIVVAANEAGNANYTAAPQVTQSIVVTQASQTITFTPPASITYTTSPILLSATAGASGNSVTFSIVSGPGTLSGAVFSATGLTVTGVGTIVVAANEAGNANYAAAPQVTQSIVVTQASQTITFTPPASPVVYGVSPIALVATGGASGNAVVFSVASGPGTVVGSMLTITGVGTVVVAANQAGNANYTAAPQVTQSIVVNAAGVAATPTFSPVAGTYTAAQSVTISDTTTGATIYYTTNGSTPTTSSTVYSGAITVASTETLEAIAAATGYTTSAVASAAYTIASPAPAISGLSPAFTNAGGAAFTLTVNGSGFISGSTVYWGASALTTTYVSATQLSAQVPATDIAATGTYAITVQTTTPGGGTSNAWQFEVDSASSGSSGTTITSATETVTAGSTASYPVTVPSAVTGVSVTCLNLPTGATCSYNLTSNAVTIATTSTTPKGTYQIIVVFTETVTSAGFLLPIFLLPLAFIRRKSAARSPWLTACLGLVLLASAVFAIGCGSGGIGGSTTPPATHQVTTSGSVTLTIQ